MVLWSRLDGKCAINVTSSVDQHSGNCTEEHKIQQLNRGPRSELLLTSDITVLENGMHHSLDRYIHSGVLFSFVVRDVCRTTAVAFEATCYASVVNNVSVSI